MRRTLPLLTLLGLAACSGDDLVLPAEGAPAAIAVVRGDDQSGRVGSSLADPVVVEVTDARDRPVEGVRVAFEFDGGAGSDVVPDTGVTNADGRTSAELELGTEVGEARGEARVVGSGPMPSVEFTATATAAPQPPEPPEPPSPPEPPGPKNGAPTAASDAYTTTEGFDHTLSVAAPGVLANDTDPDGNQLRAENASDPPHGRVTLNTNGSFTYNPDAEYWGEDSFTYRVNDGTATSNTATVTITVLSVNDAPRFSIRGGDQRVRAGSGPQRVERFAEVLSTGAANEAEQTVEFLVDVEANDAGLFSQAPAISPDGILTYTPSSTTGSARITVRLRDNGGTANGGDDTSPPQTFTITLTKAKGGGGGDNGD